MRRLAPLLLVLTAACSGGGDSPGGSTGPKPVSMVTVAAPSASINVGQQVTLTFLAFDAAGTTLSGRTASWTSSSAAVATVTSAGVVTGVAAGVATITATVEGKVGITVITVNAGQSACAGVTPLSLAVGEVRVLSGTERSRICLTGAAAASEYMLLAFNNSLDTTGLSAPARFDATGTALATGLPAANLSTVRAPEALAFGALERPIRNRSFDASLRRTERTELGSRLRVGGRAALSAARGVSRSGQPASIKGVTGLPAVGTRITLNTNSTNACTGPTNQTGRVVAVTNSAIVVADTAAPADGFSDAEYAAFGTTFDTLVFGLDTTVFGAPSDMDGNGRVVIFFTQAVNQLTSASATSVIGGFFFARDLFPASGTSPLGACTASNEAEMFYVPVVDAASQYNPYFRNKTTVQADLIGTLAHELQHLINAGRRMYVNDADDFEVAWLNEGLSHVAEELLYYRISGLAPRADLTLQVVTATQQLAAAINAYQVDNLLRLSDYMKVPEQSSPYKDATDLVTRGATWQFLRYLVDRGTAPENGYFRALVNARSNGMANLSAVMGGIFVGGIREAFQSWAIAQFLDNTGLTTDARYANASWNFRSILTNQLGNTGFPLKAKPLLDGGVQNFTLPAGGAAYMRFRVNAAAAATIIPSTLASATDLVLVRTQ